MSKHARGFGWKVSSAKVGSVSLISPLQIYVLFHFATARWIPSVDSNHKALSAIERSIPSLIILLKINRHDWTRLLNGRLN